jgi:hypothetical protein
MGEEPSNIIGRLMTGINPMLKQSVLMTAETNMSLPAGLWETRVIPHPIHIKAGRGFILTNLITSFSQKEILL